MIWCIDGLDRVDDDAVVLVCLSSGEDVFEVVRLVYGEIRSFIVILSGAKNLVRITTLEILRFRLHYVATSLRMTVFLSSYPLLSLGDLTHIFFTRKIGNLHLIVLSHLLDDLEHDGRLAYARLSS